MKIQVLLFAAILCTSSLSAQTKKIAHRSHSGSDVEFSTDNDNDNFGVYIRPDTTKHVVAPKDTAKPAVAPSDAAKQNTKPATTKKTKRKTTTKKKTK